MLPTSVAAASGGPEVPESPLHAAASPEVLRHLNSLWVRQLRNRAVGWGVVVAFAATLLLLSGARPGGPLYLLIGLITLNLVSSSFEWWRASTVDPIAAATPKGVAAAERERTRFQLFNERLASRRSLATGLVAGLVVAVMLIEWLTAGSAASTVARAGLVKPLVSDGEWWRLATAMFVHANALHLSWNLAALAAFGRIVEAYVPRPWFLVTYVVSGLAGSLASWWLMPNTPSLGASGAVMGIIGFLVVLGWRRPDELPSAVRERAGMALVLTGCIGAMAFALIDNAAHAGGAVAGALIALLVIPKQGSTFRGASSRWLSTAGWIAAIAIVAGAARAATALAVGTPAIVSVLSSDTDVVVPIRSVTATVDRDVRGWLLVIRNNSDFVLEAYEINIAGVATAGRLWRDDCCFGADGTRPIPPGTWSRIELGTIRPNDRPHVSISFALFGDGSFEGSRLARDHVTRRRTQVVGEASFWIEKIDAVRTVPAPEAAARLESYIRARSKFGDASDGARKAYRIGDLVTVALHDPARFAEEAARTKSLVEASREALLARLNRTPR